MKINILFFVKNHKKLLAIAAILGGCFGGISYTVNAAYPVHDFSNYAQIVKTLGETVKIKTVLGQQISSMLKDMGILDEAQYEKVIGFLKKTDAVSDKINKETSNLFASDGSIRIQYTKDGKKKYIKVPTEMNVEKMLNANIPTLLGSGNASIESMENTIITTTGFLMHNNENALKGIQKLSAQLNIYQKQLDDLMETNAHIKKGSTEAQQIGNQIQIVRGKIDYTLGMMDSLMEENKIYKAHAESVDKQNEIAAHQARVEMGKKSAKEAIENVVNTPKQKLFN